MADIITASSDKAALTGRTYDCTAPWSTYAKVPRNQGRSTYVIEPSNNLVFRPMVLALVEVPHWTPRTP